MNIEDTDMKVKPEAKQFENLSDLLLDSPLSGADLDLERQHDYPRQIKLD